MNEKILEKLALIKQAFGQSLPAKIIHLEKQWKCINLQFDFKLFKEFHREIHTLAGTTGTYGYHELSQACRDLEMYLYQLLDYSDLNGTQKSEISHLIEQIKSAKPEATVTIEQIALLAKQTISNNLILYLIKKKGAFELELKEKLADLGYELLFLKTVKEFSLLISTRLPAAVILDDYFLDSVAIKEFSLATYYQIPLMCLVNRSDIEIRLKAIRIGVSFFLHKPIDIFNLTNRLIQLCDLATNDDYRVLILDDSVTLAQYYTLVLEEADMSVRAISSSNQLMQQLQDFKPNLLLLDLYLPECTGFEIAKIIRQEDFYMSLPIIFISTENDRIKQLAILNSCGADDFLTKPVLPQNLVSAVKSRAQRAAAVNSYIALDNLTQLLNHTYILRQLQFEILRAERAKQPIAVAMIDLDYFKRINDQYGHPVGDFVLKKLASFLLTRVRKTDFVGRYGGEEFSIIFPDTDGKTAARICNQMCQDIAQEPFKINNEIFYITLSIGVATYPTYLTADSVVAAADKALYTAKSKGRNCVVSDR